MGKSNEGGLKMSDKFMKMLLMILLIGFIAMSLSYIFIVNQILIDMRNEVNELIEIVNGTIGANLK